VTYDYLIAGAGLFGATCARELADAGKRVLVVERQDRVGGQVVTEVRDGQTVSLCGGHIYHTNSRALWDYVGRFSEFKQYSHHVKATADGAVYSFPPNRMTYQQLGANGHTAEQVRETFFVGYTEKMWGRPIDEVPVSVLARIPMRDTWDDHYFSDAHQGLPTHGYTPMIDEMLRGIRVELGQDYLDRATYWNEKAARVVYTGPIDELCGFQLGRLEWRSLRFEHERVPVDDYQGCPTMNYCDRAVPWLRIEEWRHWWPAPAGSDASWITRTYPDPAGPPLYPITDYRNDELYVQYRAFAAGHKPNVIVGGRLGSYIYRDMAPSIAAARHLVEGLVN
jgi:UDP-galactopyranose mutase